MLFEPLKCPPSFETRSCNRDINQYPGVIPDVNRGQRSRKNILVQPGATYVYNLCVKVTELAVRILAPPKTDGIVGEYPAVGQGPEACCCVTHIAQEANGDPRNLGEMAQ